MKSDMHNITYLSGVVFINFIVSRIRVGPRTIYVEVRSRAGPKYAFFQGRNYYNVSQHLKKAIKFRPELSKKERST